MYTVVSCFVLITYSTAIAQENEPSEDTKSPVSKVKVVVTDGLEKAADATKSAVDKVKKTTTNFGNNAVDVTEDVAETVYKKGKYYTVTTWNGTKWVTKQVWFETKKAADKAEKIVN